MFLSVLDHEVVHRDHAMALREQVLAEVAPEEAGAAGDHGGRHRRRILAVGCVGAVKAQEARDLRQFAREVGAFGELARAAFDPHRGRQPRRESARDVVDDVVADHRHLARLQPEHRDGPPVGLGIRLAGADLLRDRDGVDLVLDPDQPQLPALELGRAVREDPDLRARRARRLRIVSTASS